MLSSLRIALSMYSILPVPAPAWEERNMRFAFAWLPLVGALCGGVAAGWALLQPLIHTHALLFAALAVLLAVLLSGGLHMDGFMDAADALFSRRDPAQKCAIMKDPHCGPFAVVSAVFLLLLSVAAWDQLLEVPHLLLAAAGAYTLARAQAVVLGSVRPYAPSSTLGTLFASRSSRATPWIGGVWILLSLAYMALFSWPAAMAAAGVQLLWALWYCRLTRRAFGGLTGDLLGFFIEISQLFILLTLACFTLF
ncbi:MAG: adenosylcobinamide-GDP ribazoletransferase [Oscillospiraceae bacterium]|nr:adenosylcobinamide-GDP ribazoletransferase [Oscillospiraceae bacterium]